MALNAERLQQAWLSKLAAIGFDVENMHSSMKDFLKCGTEAIVEEINSNGKANVTGGSSAGKWPIE